MNPNYPEQPNSYPPQTPPVAPVQPTDNYAQPQMPAPVQTTTPYVPHQTDAFGYQPDPYLAQSSYTPAPAQPNMYVTEPVQKKKKPVLLFIIIGAILLLGLLAGGAVYAWQAGWFGGATPAEETTPTPTATESAYETPGSIETELTATQEALDSIDDSQLADDTLSDATLHQ